MLTTSSEVADFLVWLDGLRPALASVRGEAPHPGAVLAVVDASMLSFPPSLAARLDALAPGVAIGWIDARDAGTLVRAAFRRLYRQAVLEDVARCCEGPAPAGHRWLLVMRDGGLALRLVPLAGPVHLLAPSTGEGPAGSLLNPVAALRLLFGWAPDTIDDPDARAAVERWRGRVQAAQLRASARHGNPDDAAHLLEGVRVELLAHLLAQDCTDFAALAPVLGEAQSNVC